MIVFKIAQKVTNLDSNRGPLKSENVFKQTRLNINAAFNESTILYGGLPTPENTHLLCKGSCADFCLTGFD